MLATAGKGSRPLIPGATSQKIPASRVNTQKPITKYLRTSPVVPPVTPTPPSTSNQAPHPSPPEAQPSPDPAAQALEVIPVSSEKVGGSCSATKRAAPEGPQDKTPEEAEVNSQDKAEALANDDADVESSEIKLHKKEISDFSDQRKEQHALHYELNKNISLQRRVTLSQEEDIQVGKERIAELEKKLAEAQGASSSLATASSELESPRFAYQDLETRLMEAEKKRECAEKQM
ncbi:hypothetical protein QYE76_067089 [Lolium multiflorum]|uniref:Uncharacterized protein n=1 Tax=Lolium multiflorum TaxID=4521 RepID=A0AAD8SCN0_LOLMU|nr:hypothetical protein QYE76_067089 [Lolium multiflorum]